MASLSTDPPDNILLHLLRVQIGNELRADLRKVAEAHIDEAVNRAVAGLDVHIERVFSERHAGALVNVMVERIRPKEGT